MREDEKMQEKKFLRYSVVPHCSFFFSMTKDSKIEHLNSKKNFVVEFLRKSSREG